MDVSLLRGISSVTNLWSRRRALVPIPWLRWRGSNRWKASNDSPVSKLMSWSTIACSLHQSLYLLGGELARHSLRAVAGGASQHAPKPALPVPPQPPLQRPYLLRPAVLPSPPHRRAVPATTPAAACALPHPALSDIGCTAPRLTPPTPRLPTCPLLHPPLPVWQPQNIRHHHSGLVLDTVLSACCYSLYLPLLAGVALSVCLPDA